MKDFSLLVCVLSLPIALVLVFPYEAIGFRAQANAGERAARCAIVTLSEHDETVALESARGAFRQAGGESVRRLRVDMSVGQLPEEALEAIMPERPSRPGGKLGFAAYRSVPMPKSEAAGEPATLPREADGARPVAFSREEMLAIE